VSEISRVLAPVRPVYPPFSVHLIVNRSSSSTMEKRNSHLVVVEVSAVVGSVCKVPVAHAVHLVVEERKFSVCVGGGLFGMPFLGMPLLECPDGGSAKGSVTREDPKKDSQGKKGHSPWGIPLMSEC